MNKYIRVAYDMVALKGDTTKVLYQSTPAEPDQFVSGMGVMLDAFEQHLADLADGATFEFTLQPDEAFGQRDPNRMFNVPRSTFEVDGRFDSENIYEGAQVPLQNEQGDMFWATIVKVGVQEVSVDLNDPLAGIPLLFRGTVLENREATVEEIARTAQMLSGEGCHCGCGCDHDGHGCDCDDHDCGCHHHDHDCGCGCHHHE